MAKLWMGHFDSVEDDKRRLMAEDWAKYNRALITDGIRNGGSCLQVTHADFMQVKINTGIANIQGYIMRIDDNMDGNDYKIEVPPAHNQHSRIDRVIIRLDRAIQTRTISPIILRGEASATPKATELTRNDIIWEISLAQILVEPNATNIHPIKITDERFNNEVCGIMNSYLGIDADHWQTDFDNFMKSVSLQDISFIEQRLNEFNTKFLQLQLLIDAIETSVLTKIERSFDNWEMRRGTITKTQNLDNGDIIQTITVIVDSFLLGTKLIEKNFDGKSGIRETIIWYEYNMQLDNGLNVNFTNTKIIKETSKSSNKDIIEYVI